MRTKASRAQRVRSRRRRIFAGVAIVTMPVTALVFATSAYAIPTRCNVRDPINPTYLTIQSAVDDSTCEIINVAPGIYLEDVIINRTVTLNGSAGSGGGAQVNGATGAATFTITAPGVTLNGFLIRKSGSESGLFGIFVDGNGDNALITGNTIERVTNTLPGGTAQGIFLNEEGPDDVSIQYNQITNLTGSGGAYGVLVAEAQPGTSGLTINQNNFNLPASQFGIAVQPSLTGGRVDGECNWWNSSTGPTSAFNPGGAGAQVSRNVDYSPWLLSAAPDGTCAGRLDKKACEKSVEQDKKDFEDQQKAEKGAFNATSHTKEEKKAFEDKQKADKKVFDDQNKADKEACKS
jgi:hypothetical protein